MLNKTKEIFHLNVSRLIEKDGRFLQTIADKCELSLSTINQLKAGTTGYSADTVEKLCNGLGCKPSDLFVDQKKAIKSKEELIADIVTRLPTLDHGELKDTLSAIDSLVEGRASSLKTALTK